MVGWTGPQQLHLDVRQVVVRAGPNPSAKFPLGLSDTIRRCFNKPVVVHSPQFTSWLTRLTRIKEVSRSCFFPPGQYHLPTPLRCPMLPPLARMTRMARLKSLQPPRTRSRPLLGKKDGCPDSS